MDEGGKLSREDPYSGNLRLKIEQDSLARHPQKLWTNGYFRESIKTWFCEGFWVNYVFFVPE